MSDQKIFDDFKSVDCNSCERYWLNQCDGAKPCTRDKNTEMPLKGSKLPCNSFIATRNVVIPLQIKSLQRAIKWLIGIDVMLVGLIVGIFIFLI